MDQQPMRVECHLAAHANGPAKERVKGWVRQLSTAGMFVETEGRLPVGTRCEISLFLHGADDPRAAHAFGEVVRDKAGGMAVQILGIDSDAAEALRRLTDSQPAPHAG
jgi:hypothetical protein